MDDSRDIPIYTTAELVRWFGHTPRWWRRRRPPGATRWTFAAVAAVLGVPDTDAIPLPRAPVPTTIHPDYAWGAPRLVRGAVAWHIVLERLLAGESDASVAADWDLAVADVIALRTAHAKGVKP